MDLAEPPGRLLRAADEGEDVSADRDHEPVHRVADPVRGSADPGLDPVEEVPDLREIQRRIRHHRDDLGVGVPSRGGDALVFGIDPPPCELAGVPAAGGDARHRVFREHLPGRTARPPVELPAAQPRPVGHETREVHRVGIPAGVELARELLPAADLPGDNLHVGHADAEQPVGRPMRRECPDPPGVPPRLELRHHLGQCVHQAISLPGRPGLHRMQASVHLRYSAAGAPQTPGAGAPSWIWQPRPR